MSLSNNKIYVGWVEGGWGDSGFTTFASLDKIKLMEIIKKDLCENQTIQIFDSETCEKIEDCHILVNYIDGHTCRCSECKPVLIGQDAVIEAQKVAEMFQ